MRVPDQVRTRAQAAIPMRRQIQALHLMQRARRLVVGDGQPRFTESDIAEVSDLDLTEIDVSNPFLWR